MNLADFDRADLPESLRAIEKLIGFEATLNLIDAYGGVRLYVPQSLASEHELARVLGYEAAIALAKVYGQCNVHVPRASKLFSRARDRALIRDRAKLSVRELAIKYRLSEWTVWAALRRLKDGLQEDLVAPDLYPQQMELKI